MSIRHAGFETVGTYLQKGIYFIPDYQREYSWLKDEQVEDFWLDLIGVVDEEIDAHFFGQIVIHDDKQQNKKYIIDGQQRTTTSVIFLSVLRDWFFKMYTEYKIASAQNKFEDIRVKLIGRWSEEENELRLTLGRVDKEYFMYNIQINSPSSKPNEKSHSRIYEAYHYLFGKIANTLEEYADPKQKYECLLKYYRKFTEGFKLMCVETDEINEAFIIFETLNARGKDLETSDLLKNHLFRSAGPLIESVKESWLKTVENLDNIDMTKYLRHYWNSHNKFTREKDLYKNVRNHIDSPKKAEDFIRNLYRMSDVYKSLVNPSEEQYFNSAFINTTIENLKILGASTFYPIILAMVNNEFNENDILEVLRVLEIFIFRNNVVAKKVANKYEVIFSQIALNITEKKLLNPKDIYHELRYEMLNDDDFEALFKTFIVKDTNVAKYILREINDYNEQEIHVNRDNKKVHLEHIMPQKIGNWEVDEDTHKLFLNRLGNLTLLGQEYNTSLKNKPFNIKVETYKDSKIKLTRHLCSYKEWNTYLIEKRQSDLFEIAKLRWALPKDFYSTQSCIIDI